VNLEEAILDYAKNYRLPWLTRDTNPASDRRPINRENCHRSVWISGLIAKTALPKVKAMIHPPTLESQGSAHPNPGSSLFGVGNGVE
jgi:hypothetical protein